MRFDRAVDYILSFTDYEKTPAVSYTAANYDLRRMHLLLETLGNPHEGRKTIHIAGSKGKGSTAAMTASVLSASGYRTGLYTSPHFSTFRERIRIDNVMISEKDFGSLMQSLKPAAEAVNITAAFGRLTTFELLTALMFLYYKKEKVDFQVLETGMGGRLDATNIVQPDICIITSISLDHTAILGDTVAKIAAEKAGIIKQGCPVIVSPQQEEAMSIIRDTCRNKSAPLIQIGRDVTWERTGGDLSGQSLVIRTAKQQYEVAIPLIGDFQQENTVAAVAALETLALRNDRISGAAIRKGLAGVRWPGRFHVVSRNPFVIIDGAHNAYSMKLLIEAVKKYVPCRRCRVIIGTSSDKDIAGMAREIAGFTHDVTATASVHPRAADPDLIASVFEDSGIHAIKTTTVEQALLEAMSASQGNDCIVATGSLFVAGEALRYFNKKTGV